ncbi:MAG: hypothetical protein ACLSVD_01285 [Eggerthellaceae bacterium]
MSETRCERELGKKPWTQMLLRLDDDMPLLKYFGFACWVAWFSVAYSSSVWVEGAEETASVVSDMFLYSTLSHATALLACACFRRCRRWPIDPGFGERRRAGGVGLRVRGAGGLAAGVVDRAVRCGKLSDGHRNGGAQHQRGIAVVRGSAPAGLACHSVLRAVGCFAQFMVLGLPDPFDLALFVALPLLSAACFVVGSAQRAKPVVQESQRLKPSKAFGLFLLVVCV